MVNFRSTKNVEDAEKNHLDESNTVHFPLTDAIERQFIKAISLTDDTAIAPDYINHWAHKDHPLVLSDQLKKNNTIEMVNRDDDQILLCDGCVRPILIDQFYGCVQCNFFLHRVCAELPPKLQHASHPEHELVRYKYTKPIYYINCYKCGFLCGFSFIASPANSTLISGVLRYQIQLNMKITSTLLVNSKYQVVFARDADTKFLIRALHVKFVISC